MLVHYLNTKKLSEDFLEEGTYVICNLDMDLKNIISRNPIVTKVYLYHCSMGSMHARRGCRYQQSLKSIVQAIGRSKTHLQEITNANEELCKLGIITIRKEWINIGENMH